MDATSRIEQFWNSEPRRGFVVSTGVAGGWFALSVDDARAEFERLHAAGVDFTDEISKKEYGIDFGIRDPFGNRIRVGTMTPG